MADDDAPEPGELYDRTVRDMLPATDIVGRRIVDVTQHDRMEYIDGAKGHVDLLLDNGSILSFYDNGDVELSRPHGHVTTLSLNPDPNDDE